MMKLALMRNSTGKEDPELPLLQRIRSLELTVSHEDHHRKGRPRVTSAAEDKFISYQPQIAAQINALQSSSSRHISTATVQRRLGESGLHG